MKGSLKIWMVILGIVAAGSGITCLTNSYVNRQIKKMEETVPYKQESVLAGTKQEAAGGGQEMAEAEAENQEEKSLEQEPQKLQEAAEDANEVQEDAPVSAKAAPEALATPFQAVSEGMVTGQSKEADTGREALAEGGEGALMISAAPEGNLQEALREYQERFPQIDLQIEQMRKSETENNVYSVKNTAQTELRIWEREMESLYRLLCDSLDEMACEQLKKEQQEWLQLREDRAEEAAKRNSGGSLESVDYLASMAASNRERAYALLEKYQE